MLDLIERLILKFIKKEECGLTGLTVVIVNGAVGDKLSGLLGGQTITTNALYIGYPSFFYYSKLELNFIKYRYSYIQKLMKLNIPITLEKEIEADKHAANILGITDIADKINYTSNDSEINLKRQYYFKTNSGEGNV